MSAAAVAPELDEVERIVAWKVLMLLELGFSLDQSMLLVSMRGFDWWAAKYLVDRGCSHILAVEILT